MTPDVQFVDRLLRRRLGPHDRMAFRVAADCLEGEDITPISVFCSRYGEFYRAFEILSDLAKGETVSPNTFSLSVHNAASSLFSIMQQNRASSTALASGQATLEAGFLEAWTLLAEHEASSVLLVCSDQVLPEAYANQETGVRESAALALLLGLPRERRGSPMLGLTWNPRNSPQGAADEPENSLLNVAKLLLEGGDPIKINTGRLHWTWSYHGSAA